MLRILLAFALAACAAAAPDYKALPFGVDRVSLLKGTDLRASQDRDLAYLLSLDSRRLLCTHTKAAGVDKDCVEYNHQVYYEHFLGHWLSAASLMTASTGDISLRKKAEGVVSQLKACQDSWSKKSGLEGYLFAHDPSAIEVMEQTALTVEYGSCFGYWPDLPVSVPFYNVHKTLAGLIDAYKLMGNKEALQVASRLGTWIARHVETFVAEHGVDGWQRVMCEEWGGVNDAMYNLFDITADPAHLRAAERFEKYYMTVPLSQGADPLSGMHANTHIPQFIGAARGFEETGNLTKKAIAENFFKLVQNTRTYATFGSNDHEWWPEPHRLGNDLDEGTEESCTQYNMLKLSRIFFTWYADASIADFYERAIMNGIWGNSHTNADAYIYMLPMGPANRKPWGDAHDDWFPCCWGTLSESFAKLADSVYFRSPDNSIVYINQFVGTTLEWSEIGVSLTQETSFPVTSKTNITISKPGNKGWTMALRVPSWATGDNKISINGVDYTGQMKPGSYAMITRAWKAGDKITADFPMKLWAQHIDDDRAEFAAYHAVMYGPVVLAGITSNQMALTKPENVGQWLSRVSETELKFEGRNPKGFPTTFIPLYKIMDETYTTYFIMTSSESEVPAKLQKKESPLAAEHKRRHMHHHTHHHHH